MTAAEQGVLALRGGCVPLGEEGVPYAPLTEAPRGLARALDPDELEAVDRRRSGWSSPNPR